MLVCIFIVTLINIDISGIARISLAIDTREGYEGSILFHSCKIDVSESSPTNRACKYCSASFINAVLTLLCPILCQCCLKIPFRVWGTVEDHG